MVGEHKIRKIGNKRYMSINCVDWADSPSLGNSNFFKIVVQKLKEHKNIDSLIFERGYKKILSEKSFKILREYIDTLESLPSAPELCDHCFEASSILSYKLEEDPVGALIHLYNISPCKIHKAFFEKIKKKFDKTKILKLIEKYKGKYEESELYHVIFKDRILPGFITFFIEPLPEGSEILENYEVDGAKIQIYKQKGQPYPIYHITPKELNLSRQELLILNRAFEKLSKEEFDIKRGSVISEKVISDVAPELSDAKKKELAYILKRYSFGYGIVEVLFKDHKLQDIYVDSPGDKPIYVYHGDYEECTTNIIMSPEELEKLSTRFRLLSGRPFDESYPMLHADIKDLGIRIAGITEPMTFEGTGFAFRKHASQPWTLQQFIKNKMISSEAAGFLSFLVDGQQSILITGSRGSGKTSLLSSLITEIPQNFRIILIEDTPEVPVEKLRDLGYNLQHLRVKSTLERESYEVTADEALRNALRLGESVLIIGEVRGEEARSLFEAMRIGAAGNVVMGTIHGNTAYDVWDRIVNDLKVPSTSFKAADVIISCSPLRMGEDIKRHRKVIGINEVLKYWTHDPQKEKGFLNLMDYNRRTDKLSFSKNLRKSPTIKEIAKKKGISVADAIKNIKTRTKIKEEIVKASKKNPKLLNVTFAIMSNNKLLELFRDYKKKVNYNKVLRDFKKWITGQVRTFNG